MVTLPEHIDERSTGHFAHHMALHIKYNEDTAVLTNVQTRLAVVESQLVGFQKQQVSQSFSFAGTLPDGLLSQMRWPSTVDGTIARVEGRLNVPGTNVVSLVTVNGASIFTPPSYPELTFGSGQQISQAIPDPAKRTISVDDDVSVHIANADGSPGFLVVTVVIDPD